MLTVNNNTPHKIAVEQVGNTINIDFVEIDQRALAESTAAYLSAHPHLNRRVDIDAGDNLTNLQIE
jgi:hypothetical protein